MRSILLPASFLWESKDDHCRKTRSGVMAGVRNANVQEKASAVFSKVCEAKGIRRLLEEGPQRRLWG